MPQPLSAALRNALLLALIFALSLIPRPGFAQGTGTVTGTVTRAGEGSPLPSVSVSIQSGANTVETITGPDGRYTLRRVPEGSQTVVFKWLGYRPVEKQATVEAGGTARRPTSACRTLEPRGLMPMCLSVRSMAISGPPESFKATSPPARC